MLTPYDTENMTAYTVPNIINRLGYNTTVKDVLEEKKFRKLVEERKKEKPERFLGRIPDYNWLKIPKGALDTGTIEKFNDPKWDEIFHNFLVDGHKILSVTMDSNYFLFVFEKNGK